MWEITHKLSYQPEEISINTHFLSSSSGRVWEQTNELLEESEGSPSQSLRVSLKNNISNAGNWCKSPKRWQREDLPCYWENLPVGLGLLLKFGRFPPSIREAPTSSTRTVNATSHSCSLWMQSIIYFTCRRKGQGSTWAFKFSSLLKAQIQGGFALRSQHCTVLCKRCWYLLIRVTHGINRSFLRLSIFVGGN